MECVILELYYQMYFEYLFCVLFRFKCIFINFRPEQHDTVMSKVKSKIRKGKLAGREEEETTEEGTDLLCCVPDGQGTAEVSH